MAVDRVLPTEEGAELVALVREIAQSELAPQAAEAEAEARPTREVFRLLGDAGLLGMAYPEEYGGVGQPYEVYLQVLEEIAAAWMSVGVGVSVHTMTSYALASYGTERAAADATCRRCSAASRSAVTRCPRPQAGSDITSMTTRAVRDGDGYVAERCEGVDHPRRRRRLLHDVRTHQPRPHPRDQLLPRAGRRSRCQLREPRAQDGPDRLTDGGDVSRRRAVGRRPADR